MNLNGLIKKISLVLFSSSKNLKKKLHSLVTTPASDTCSFSCKRVIRYFQLRWLNTVLAVCEYTLFAKLWQEKGCSSQAETWQVTNILMKEFD